MLYHLPRDVPLPDRHSAQTARKPVYHGEVAGQSFQVLVARELLKNPSSFPVLELREIEHPIELRARCVKPHYLDRPRIGELVPCGNEHGKSALPAEIDSTRFDNLVEIVGEADVNRAGFAGGSNS